MGKNNLVTNRSGLIYMSNMPILLKFPFKYITLEENLAEILREIDVLQCCYVR